MSQPTRPDEAPLDAFLAASAKVTGAQLALKSWCDSHIGHRVRLHATRPQDLVPAYNADRTVYSPDAIVFGVLEGAYDDSLMIRVEDRQAWPMIYYTVDYSALLALELGPRGD